MYKLGGRMSYKHITWDTPDISKWCKYDWYSLCWYHEPGFFSANEPTKLAHWLRVAYKVGQKMCFWVLSDRGELLAMTSVQPLSPEDLPNLEVKWRAKHLDNKIANWLRCADNDSAVCVGPEVYWDQQDNTPFRDFDLEEPQLRDEQQEVQIDLKNDEPYEPKAMMPEADDFTTDQCIQYINAKWYCPKERS